ncbi:hypothetical protein V8J36_19835 [Frigidibacter sp. MR17.14]|uniref:hypothetical protein n=1 Tax=Frigidibacter sp. MR17.14 TaxID=3126509 RepID=UPI003012A942
MKLSFSERIHERIAALFPLPEALPETPPETPPEPVAAPETAPPGAAADAAAPAVAARIAPPEPVESPTPFGRYRFAPEAGGTGWVLCFDGATLARAAAPRALAEAYHADLATRIAALMATHSEIAALSGTISGREPGGRRWSLDVTGDGLLRMVSLGLREPDL